MRRPIEGHPYWVLLKATLPGWYRHRYARQLLRTHEDAAADDPTRSRLVFWARLTADVLATAIQARLPANAATQPRQDLRDVLHPTERRMTMTWSEVRFETYITVRSLLRRPGYTTSAILTLGLGLGVAGSIFALVHGSLLRPLPYPEPDRVLHVRDLYEPTGGSGGMSIPNFSDLRDGESTLQEFAAYAFTSANLAEDGSSVRVQVATVSDGFLDVLRVAPPLGRDFTPEEGQPGAQRSVILTHRLWLDLYGGDPSVVDRSITLDGRSFPVVGVLPEDFWFLGDPEILVPLQPDPATASRGSRQIEGIARLDDGIELGTAESDLRAIFARLAEEFPGGNDGWTVRAVPLADFALARNRTAFQLLAGAALLLVLVGCVNVANLMLVRAERRQKEIAVRAAVGAGRRRLGRQLLGESLLLTAGASLLGLFLTWLGAGVLVAFWGDALPRAANVALTPLVAGFTLVTGFVASIAIALIPMGQIELTRLFDTLREGSVSARRSSRRAQRVLVTAEVALAVLLVAGAGLLVRSAWKAGKIDSGVQLENALVYRVQLPESGYGESSEVTAYFRRAVEEVGRLPGVQAVGITDRIPLQGGYNITTLHSPVDPQLESSFVEIRRVTPDLFAAAGIPVLQGRGLTETDGATEADVVVISEKLANDLFPDGNALGQRVDPGWNDDGYEVVGIVGSVREFGLLRSERPALYWPFPVAGTPLSMTFVVRTTSNNPMDLMPQIRSVMNSIDPSIPPYQVATMEDVATQTLGSRLLATNLFAAFGVMALILAGIGVFGVLAYSVEQRTREIGIRIAIGAKADRVTRHVLGQGIRLVLLGLAFGGLGAFLGGGLLSALLYEVSPNDALTLSAVMLVVLCASIAASWLPARRAARVEPSIALRSE